MSMKFMFNAMGYFEKYKDVLGVLDSVDLEDCIFRSNNDGRLRFLQAVFDDINNFESQLTEEVMLGGLRLISDDGASLLPSSIFSDDVPFNRQLESIQSMYTCFANIFNRYCDSARSGNVTSYAAEWDLLCVMWWDVLPRHGVPYKIYLRDVDGAILKSLGQILKINNFVCKESALHGLGHWYHAYPEEVDKIIFLNSDVIPHELKDFASKAATGNVQ